VLQLHFGLSRYSRHVLAGVAPADRAEDFALIEKAGTGISVAIIVGVVVCGGVRGVYLIVGWLMRCLCIRVN